jgi:osmotically-inducible protein OsmY
MADRNKNMGEDWDQNRNRFNQENDFNQRKENKGNTGYSGQIARGRETESQGIYNSGRYNEYDRVNYFPDNDENRNYNDRDYENTQYGTSGTYGYKGNRGEYAGNYNQGGYENRGNYGNRNYGNDYNRQDINEGYGQRNYKSDFEKRYYQQQQGGHGNYVDGYGNDYNRNRPVNRYGGDTRNYGNANQGGFDRDWWDRTKDEVASWFGDDEAERRRQMDRRYMHGHRGKGPKNYHRSEERIREEVCDRLADDDMVDASEMEVQVQGREVILTGYVPSREQKRRAEDIVESVSSVRNVENRLRVGHGQTESTTNGNIGATGSTMT